DYHDFGPHLGFAWDIFGNGKTALRGGYSLTFDVPNFGTLAAPYSFARARAGVFTEPNLGFFQVANFSGDSVLPTDPAATCYDPVRPLFTAFPDLRNVLQICNHAKSQYDSLQASFNQRNRHWLDTQYNLTWSKCFDLNSENRGGQGDYPQISNDGTRHPSYNE